MTKRTAATPFPSIKTCTVNKIKIQLRKEQFAKQIGQSSTQEISLNIFGVGVCVYKQPFKKSEKSIGMTMKTIL